MSGGHLANFIEKERPGAGHFKIPRLSSGAGPREGPLDIAEQFALQNVLRQGGAIDGDKGGVGAPAEIMEALGEHLLAGSGPSGDEHRAVALGEELGLVDGRAHHLAAPDDVVKGILGDVSAFRPFAADALVQRPHRFNRLKGEHHPRRPPLPRMGGLLTVPGVSPMSISSLRSAAFPATAAAISGLPAYRVMGAPRPPRRSSARALALLFRMTPARSTASTPSEVQSKMALTVATCSSRRSSILSRCRASSRSRGRCCPPTRCRRCAARGGVPERPPSARPQSPRCPRGKAAPSRRPARRVR